MMPLEGITVLDLSRMAPGPFCTMILGDMGADVLKVEAPASSTADEAEPGSPEAASVAWVRAHDALNRNKRSIVLNLKTESGRGVFHRLARSADVVVTEARPGVPEKLGVGYAQLKELYPRLVYCAITGFGQSGPYMGLPAHDINCISIAGALGLIGLPEGEPVIPANLLGDFAGGGLQAVIGILLALRARDKTGKGQLVDISMTDGILQLLTWSASSYLASGKVPRRGEPHVCGGEPDYGVYQTRDGKYVSIAMGQPKFWRNFCSAVGREDLIRTQALHFQGPTDVRAALGGIFSSKTREEWVRFAQSVDTCITPVHDLAEALADPQVRHREMVVEVDGPGVGPVRQIGISAKLSDTPGRIRSLAPEPGRHTDEVLQGLGYGAEQIATLRRSGGVA